MPEFKDVFISYGRKESLAFATKLFHRLEGTGCPTWFDHVNIPKGDDFQRHIDDGIRSAHNFIYIIAPHANASEFCLKEIELAFSLGKRIIPVLHIDRDLDRIHTEIGARNWIYAREKEDANLPLEEWAAIDDFEQAFADLIALLNKEKEYVEKHTEVLWDALEWQNKQQQTQFLLVGKERQEAEEWLLTEFTPPKQPPCKPTDLHCQYICNARKNAENLMTDVFICYDTVNRDIRDKVISSLARHVITTWTHDQDIAKGAQYARAIEEGIEQANSFLFFISPESLRSEYCQKEIRHALQMNKRVIPLLVRDVDEKELTDFEQQSGLTISSLQYIDFTDNTVQADYDADVDQILNLLKKDRAYFEQHKILLSRAIQWEKEGKKQAFLLRGFNLENATTWFRLNQKREQYAPTNLHHELISASEAAKGALGTEVFISYSRKDADFARELNLNLQESGKTTWFDQESISSGVDFETEIFKGIDSADNIVFILSPDSVESEYCEREVAYAAEQSKRFITVLHRPTEPETMPVDLRKINWIDFENTEYDKAFAELIQAIELDREHAQYHTKLQQRASEWWVHQQLFLDGMSIEPKDLLLNATAYEYAQGWLKDGAHEKTPPVTELQSRYIGVSGEEIQRLEAKEKAVATSLKKRLRTSRIAIGIAVLLLGVAGYYIYESNRLFRHSQLLNERANLNRIQAEEQRDKAKEAQKEAEMALVATQVAEKQRNLAERQQQVAEVARKKALQQAKKRAVEAERERQNAERALIKASQSDSLAQLRAEEAEIAKNEAEAQLAALQKANGKRVVAMLKNEVKEARNNGDFAKVLEILDVAAGLEVEKQRVAENYAEMAFIYAHNPDKIAEASTILSKAAKLLEVDIPSAINSLKAAKEAIQQLAFLKPLHDKYYPITVPVEAGEFDMGRADNEWEDTKLHRVSLDAYQLAKHETTVAQYRLFCLATDIPMPEAPSWGWNENHVMIKVSWYDALNYCNWQSLQNGLAPVYKISGNTVRKNIKESTNYVITIDPSANGYRLPTEAEWEFAARGGKDHWSDNFLFAGSNVLNDVAWHDNNANSSVQPVGMKKPNQLGLYDMTGNAREWCWDIYEEDYPSKRLNYNPQGSEEGTQRVDRGGAWDEGENLSHVAYRDMYNPYDRNIYVGFRVAKNR